MKTSSCTGFCRAGIFLITVILVYYFFNSITADFDLDYTILVGIVPSFLLNFLHFLNEDRDKWIQLYIQWRVMTCSLWICPSGFWRGTLWRKSSREEWLSSLSSGDCSVWGKEEMKSKVLVGKIMLMACEFGLIIRDCFIGATRHSPPPEIARCISSHVYAIILFLQRRSPCTHAHLHSIPETCSTALKAGQPKDCFSCLILRVFITNSSSRPQTAAIPGHTVREEVGDAGLVQVHEWRWGWCALWFSQCCLCEFMEGQDVGQLL